MTGSSGSLSCGAREVKSPCEWRGGMRHCSRVMVGESGFKTREGGFSRSFSGCVRKPCVPSTCAGDLRELLRVPLRSRDTVDLGGASRASTVFGVMEDQKVYITGLELVLGDLGGWGEFKEEGTECYQELGAFV